MKNNKYLITKGIKVPCIRRQERRKGGRKGTPVQTRLATYYPEEFPVRRRETTSFHDLSSTTSASIRARRQCFSGERILERERGWSGIFQNQSRGNLHAPGQ
ncbi:hypothetical protein PUN28_009586 [Cardiocondyla obscurior]|uniref:Uncharacterized protein n=1 Tax=Cardiocondyla obscurior TaxID=286306 RepID=A0AAW2FV00_9HYME